MNKKHQKLTVLASVSCLHDFVEGGNVCTLQFTLDQLHELAAFAVVLKETGFFLAERYDEYNLRVFDGYHPDILEEPYTASDDSVRDWETEEFPGELEFYIPYLRVHDDGDLVMTWVPKHCEESAMCAAKLPNVQELILEFRRAFPRGGDPWLTT